MMPSDTIPTRGRLKTSTRGLKPMRANAIPAMEPRRPAWGTIFCTQAPAKERASLMIPIMIMVAIPMYHVMSAASRSAIPPAFRDTKAGPSTTRARPMVEGVSRPRGMAVTSLRPVLRARRYAIHV